MYLENTRYDRVDALTRRRLRYATIPNGYLRRFVRAFPRSVIIIARHRRQLMGWGLVLQADERARLHLFVNRRYRRRGIAAAIITAAIRRFSVVTVTVWNDATWRCFRRLQRRYPRRLSVIDWYRHQAWYDQLLATH